MSSVVKCANCNVVINEVLAFVHNKISVMDDESISRICASAFSESEIVTAKNLLFESLPTTKRKIKRKKAGKNSRNIDDIICLIRDTDSEDLPVFVARDLDRLPPVLFDHVDVTRLLKDIVKLRQDLDMMKEDYATVKQMDQLRSEVQHLSSGWRNVNPKRGAYVARLPSYECDSGPMGLPMGCNENDSKCQQQTSLETTLQSNIHKIVEHQRTEGSNETVAQNEPAVAVAMTHVSGQLIESLAADAQPVRGDIARLPCASLPPDLDAGHTVEQNGSSTIAPKQKLLAEIVKEGKWKTQGLSSQWTRVQNKRPRNRFVGKVGKAISDPESKFIAAETKVPMYIYNVAKGVSVCDIRTYIVKKTNIEVKIEKMNMKLEKDYESYKIFVPKHSLATFLSNEFWPQGVAYRRFINIIRRDKENVHVTDEHININSYNL